MSSSQKGIPTNKGRVGDIKLRSSDLLGVLAWMQSPKQVMADEHGAVMKIFGEHNPQAIETLRKTTVSRQIQVGIIKIDMPQDPFEGAALKAATEQADKLDPCVLVIQPGFLRNVDGTSNYRYLLCSFFRAEKTTMILALPPRQIILD
jgi:hypothetical protein